MRQLLTCSFAALALLLSGCSTKLIGGPSDRPASLAHISVESENPGNRTTVAVRRSLKEHDIQLSSNAPLVLSLKNMRYTHPLPEQINAGVAFITTATLTVTYQLTTKGGHVIIANRTISASQNLLHNANQVNTTSMDNLFMRSLSQQLANSIYYQLSATNTIKRIDNALEKSHAAKRH
jgi:outer membrane lipopolysaccharide assembly protein LptE/RlpB